MLGGLAGLAISIGVCGAAGIVLLGWLVTLQVYSGGVGKQPGCPRACRCCCPAPKRDYPSCVLGIGIGVGIGIGIGIGLERLPLL